ncbi:MAG: hypothetical protein BWY17_03392 [Deltaproteobacteria bacterium ADurb.Bin207]|nr:MAG: hypothetical protein BWY17_03392 [Deltaproteobacteria bacterium ADurb.Bin207]HOH03053.1 hypothetical protein [Polyangiaceae bacterium]HOR37317.1 hypothetical protein [Polyangiaceae bacterium]HPK95359.1 hypothetical protein [Polyangiaceae bacterium]
MDGVGLVRGEVKLAGSLHDRAVLLVDAGVTEKVVDAVIVAKALAQIREFGFEGGIIGEVEFADFAHAGAHRGGGLDEIRGEFGARNGGCDLVQTVTDEPLGARQVSGHRDARYSIQRIGRVFRIAAVR